VLFFARYVDEGDFTVSQPIDTGASGFFYRMGTVSTDERNASQIKYKCIINDEGQRVNGQIDIQPTL
jgi:hypothetical protein